MHLHIFAGSKDHKRLPQRLEDPAAGTSEDWLQRLRRQMSALGILVQSVVYGEDNTVILEAMEKLGPDIARGIALVEPDVSKAELCRLRSLGVRGIRLNFRHREPLDLNALEAMAPRLADADLHAQVLFQSWQQAHEYAK